MQSQPIAFHPPSEQPAPVLLPPAAPFARRAQRLEHLAQEHSLADWLRLMARICHAQEAALATVTDWPTPDAARRAQALAHAMPLLDTHAPPPLWHEVLDRLLQQLQTGAPLPPSVAALVQQLQHTDPVQRESMARVLLQGAPEPAPVGLLPLVGAALQVTYLGMAQALGDTALPAPAQPGLCPCCGSPAVGSLVRLGSAINNLRYLQCSLCGTQWNLPRATCSHCGDDRSVSLQVLEGQRDAVRGECCDGCHSYLKIHYEEQDPQIEVGADDLATLALDMLLDEAGYLRSGPNLLLAGAQGTDDDGGDGAEGGHPQDGSGAGAGATP